MTSPTVDISDMLHGSLSGKAVGPEISKKLTSERETYPSDEDGIEGKEQALSPLAYDVIGWMPNTILKLPIASCGPYDANVEARVGSIKFGADGWMVWKDLEMLFMFRRMCFCLVT